MGIESRLIPKLGVKYFGISAGKFRRYHRSMMLNLIDPTTLFKNIKDFFEFLKGIKEARDILLFEKPDVVFAKGGYVSFPVGLAARWAGIPLVIHESDLVMGLSNKKMSSIAERVCVSFPVKNYDQIAKEKLEYTGNPVRDDIQSGGGESLLKKLGFSKERKTILVLGGSQGSQFINESINAILLNILENYQLLWISGERDADWINYEIKNNIPQELKKYVKVYGFATSELADLYSAADLVISRAGSNVLFELSALGKPAILIPLESSAGGHQLENAKYFSRNGAAFIFRQSNFDTKKFFKHISYVLSSVEELNKMASKIKSLADPEAADKVAKIIYETGEKSIEKNRKSQSED